MDPHFDPSKSSSASIRDCSGKKCFFRQAYSEGSSWNAFKVQDRLWIGGQMMQHIPQAQQWSVNFDFGCQDSETGLFRTQNIDGIMGMSAAGNTLPFQLMEQRITRTKTFALCFRIGGGVLTLGGFDQSLHRPSEGALRLQPAGAPDPSPGSPGPSSVNLAFARLTKSRGWYTVRLLDVRMRAQDSAVSTSLGLPAAVFNSGKGAIVDSGTTDTYLPRAAEQKFKTLFAQLAGGQQYHNNEVPLTAAQLARLPVLVYRLETDGGFVDVECPPANYVEVIGGRRYANRVYLSEAAGTVLGANFMNGFDVIFDPDGLRLGLARSDCGYKAPNSDPVTGSSKEAALDGNSSSSSGSVRGKKGKAKPFLRAASPRINTPLPSAVSEEVRFLADLLADQLQQALHLPGPGQGDVELLAACSAQCSQPAEGLHLALLQLDDDARVRRGGAYRVSGRQGWAVGDAVVSERCELLCSQADRSPLYFSEPLPPSPSLVVVDTALSACRESGGQALQLRLVPAPANSSEPVVVQTRPCAALPSRPLPLALRCSLKAPAALAGTRAGRTQLESQLALAFAHTLQMDPQAVEVRARATDPPRTSCGPFSLSLSWLLSCWTPSPPSLLVPLELQVLLARPLDLVARADLQRDVAEEALRQAAALALGTCLGTPSFARGLGRVLNGPRCNSSTARWFLPGSFTLLDPPDTLVRGTTT